MADRPLANHLERLRRLLPAVWFGLLLCVAALASPIPFEQLPRPDAGRLNGALFQREAWVSVAVALLLWALERGRARRAAEAAQGSVLSAEMVLLMGTLLCTVAGYFALQPLLAAAREGQGSWSFGQLHAVSVGCFVLKGVLAGALAWRATRPG